MTFRTSINSKDNPRDMLKRGLKSMFTNYEMNKQSTTPVDTEERRDKKKAA
ncbi:hypothetical protein [uncultured Pseudodesulfovibrio sp.]|uniref:hypothetical protein n=1 Tax=uncultured Pseudodesulfovibrio sp. TaxID=2035858 RepID=UPI0029C76B48|nr:hypothetical protein [uncultured Pseudodesulfovibrio sp.]